MHLISSIHAMWQGAGLTLRVRPYAILATSPSTGLMEMIPDTVSLAALRKRHVPLLYFILALIYFILALRYLI
jgi:phosphatidylinositol kinase/protein kinase (PI-3  family)